MAASEVRVRPSTAPAPRRSLGRRPRPHKPLMARTEQPCSKGGIAATELERQPGSGSYQTAWTWLHKLREAMVGPDREPLAGRVEADETYVGGPRPGKRGRGAAGKALVGGAVEAGRGEARGRRL